jgi:hypothetical protein
VLGCRVAFGGRQCHKHCAAGVNMRGASAVGLRQLGLLDCCLWPASKNLPPLSQYKIMYVRCRSVRCSAAFMPSFVNPRAAAAAAACLRYVCDSQCKFSRALNTVAGSMIHLHFEKYCYHTLQPWHGLEGLPCCTLPAFCATREWHQCMVSSSVMIDHEMVPRNTHCTWRLPNAAMIA